tara:strand:+ start:107433 stop:107729 length:297 start_codon:yes stop_codon:yes gene_type:complete
MGQKYNPKAKADKQLQVLVVPDSVIPDATAAKEVGKGSLCRIKGTAGGFVSFGPDDSLVVPSAVTPNTMETEAGYFIVSAPDKFIRTSAVMRIEVIKD